jgi:biotin synthase-like enzyme
MKISTGTPLHELTPFLISSIRPPTENSSLAFRLTKNCYWNKCAFCPVYKTGSKFEIRPINEVLADIASAKEIDDAMFDSGIGFPVYSSADYSRAHSFIGAVQRAKWESGLIDLPRETPLDSSPDAAMRWFSSWFIDRPDFSDCVQHLLAWRISGARTCFLGDADSLILKPEYIETVTSAVKRNFPSVERFTIYGRTKSAARREAPRVLKRFAKAGISRVHFGLESGSDRVLNLISKGETSEDHIKGCLNVKNAGISCSVYVMPGLGGAALSETHAAETSAVLNKISPDFVRLRTLKIFSGSPLEKLRDDGAFAEADEETVIREIRVLINSLTCSTAIVSDSAVNLLCINGNLPEDKQLMLNEIDNYLAKTVREKLLYSFSSRLDSFMGQYGEMPEDLAAELGSLLPKKLTDADDESLKKAALLLRSRLMP